MKITKLAKFSHKVNIFHIAATENAGHETASGENVGPQPIVKREMPHVTAENAIVTTAEKNTL